jgi:hypothetical protein
LKYPGKLLEAVENYKQARDLDEAVDRMVDTALQYGQNVRIVLALLATSLRSGFVH